jgi:hypothetical protein
MGGLGGSEQCLAGNALNPGAIPAQTTFFNDGNGQTQLPREPASDQFRGLTTND